jgi:hypothetical protein
LRWDGHVWNWDSSGTSVGGHLVVHLDFQSWMVVSLRTNHGATVWLWPERRSETLSWDALRRAVFARHGAGHHQDPRGVGPQSQDAV